MSRYYILYHSQQCIICIVDYAYNICIADVYTLNFIALKFLLNSQTLQKKQAIWYTWINQNKYSKTLKPIKNPLKYQRILKYGHFSLWLFP